MGAIRRNGPARWLLPAAVITTLLSLVGCGSGEGAKETSPAGETPAAQESPATEEEQAEEASTYESSAFNIPVTFEQGAWTVDVESASMIDIGHKSGLDGGIMSVADIGVIGPDGDDEPWPGDLHEWLGQQPWATPGEPSSVTVGGLEGTLIDVDVDWEPEGAVFGNQPVIEYGSGQFWNLIADPEKWRFVLVETGKGQGIVVLILAGPDGLGQAGTDLEELLGTLRFG